MKKIENTYSAWILPQNGMYFALSDLISKLACFDGGFIFKPHLTIIGDVEGNRHDLAMKTKALASVFQPLEIELENLLIVEKSVLITVSLTNDLMRMRQQAVEIFGQKEDEEYRPHISLFYGSVSEDIKEFLTPQFEALQKTSVAQHLYLVETPIISQSNEWGILDKFTFASL